MPGLLSLPISKITIDGVKAGVIAIVHEDGSIFTQQLTETLIMNGTP
jgi:hypothetical protein